MCGISGIVQAPRAPTRDLAADVAAMNRALAHRGPDDEGSFLGAGVGLGFRRLAIIDLSPAGHQPMCNEDGTLWLVFNGEIYNHLELRPELEARGHHFRSKCDAEVVLHAWEEWGERCFERFNGMWAFALWDTSRRRLVACRDRFGVKPFVYTVRDGELSFASEVAALRAALPLHDAHLGKLHDYLAYGARVADGLTMFDGVRELRAGHWLQWEDGRIVERGWYELPLAPVQAGAPEERSESYGQLLRDALRLRFRSDVPVALLQSGGLDSSALCSLIEEELAAGRLAQTGVQAFTAVYPGHAEDESQAVALLMRHCPHVQWVPLEPGGDLAEQLPDFVRALQEPVLSSTAYAHWCLMRAVQRQGIKVVLNGQGADEALAGYGRYVAGHRLLDVLRRAPAQLAAEMEGTREQLGMSVAQQSMRLVRAVAGRRAAAWWRARMQEGTLAMLQPQFHAAQRGHLAAPRPAGRSALDAQLREQLGFYGFGQILHYEDLSSMSCGIEIRSPFIDWRVMEAGFALPDEDRLSRGVTKGVLRRWLAPRLPAALVNNPRKIGFATPFAAWSRSGGFRRLVQSLVAERAFDRSALWRADRLEQALLEPERAPQGFAAWRFIVCALWLREMGIRNV